MLPRKCLFRRSLEMQFLTLSRELFHNLSKHGKTSSKLCLFISTFGIIDGRCNRRDRGIVNPADFIINYINRDIFSEFPAICTSLCECIWGYTVATPVCQFLSIRALLIPLV